MASPDLSNDKIFLVRNSVTLLFNYQTRNMSEKDEGAMHSDDASKDGASQYQDHSDIPPSEYVRDEKAEKRIL